MDGTTKYFLQKELRSFLYQKVFNHIEKRTLELAEANQKITGALTLAFAYRGETFAQRVVSKGGRYIIPKPLDLSLRDAMDTILKHRAHIMAECDYVMSLFSKIFSIAKTPEEVMGLLPEGIHPPIIKFIGRPLVACDLPPEMHQEVLEFNAHGYEMLRTRIMGNLVL